MIIDKIEELCLKIIEKIGLKVLANWYRDHQEGMRYLVFGGLSTVVNIIIFVICTNLISLSTTVGNSIAWIISVMFAYVTNKLYVFKSKTNNTKSLIKEIFSFTGARIATLVMETIFLIIFIDKLHFNTLLMKIISNILVILLNFILSKVWIFKKNNI